MLPLLGEMAEKLRAAWQQRAARERRRCADCLLLWHRSGGGFAGRAGPPDVYYTAFALRSLFVLDALTADTVERTRHWLAQLAVLRPSLADWLAYAECWYLLAAREPADSPVLSELPRRLRELAGPAGGYAAAPGASPSVYQTFLGLCLEQLLGLSSDAAERVGAFLQQHKQPDGGFVDGPIRKRSGANPTAAAVLTALRLAPMAAVRVRTLLEGTGAFLLSLAHPRGGFRAHTRAPVADLLSTFTSLYALEALGVQHTVDIPLTRAFVLRCQRPEGFAAGPWDESADVEYTFYGLGCLALLDTWERT